MEDAEESQAPSLRVELVAGGDPGDAVLAAVATILTRPVVLVSTATAEELDEPAPATSRWVRASRLESIEPGRRITTREDVSWGRATW